MKSKTKKVLAIFLFLLTIVLYRFYERNQSHYNIQKYSLVWFAIMDNNLVNNFPIIKNIDDVEYNWLGYNHTPYSTIEWNLNYLSRENPSIVTEKIFSYFKKRGMKLKKTSGILCKPMINLDELAEYYVVRDSKHCISFSVSIEFEGSRINFFYIT